MPRKRYSKKRSSKKRVSFKRSSKRRSKTRSSRKRTARRGHKPGEFLRDWVYDPIATTAYAGYRKARAAGKSAGGSVTRFSRATGQSAGKYLGGNYGVAYGNITGGPLGGVIGHSAGQVAGKYLGGKIGGAIGYITGHGDYHVQDNSILHGSQIPSFAGKNSVRVRHREYVTDVESNETFTLSNYYINPGLANLFPWLATIANNFEEYKFHGLVFEFRSTAANSVGSTNLALGTVVMATEYNATIPNYVSKLQMENSEFSSSCNVCDSMLHPIECKKSETVLGELYIRDNTQTSTQDQRLFDLGNFQIATTGCQANGNTIGELWVSYDIEFFKAKLGSGAAGEAISFAHYTSTAGIATTKYFGTGPTNISSAGAGTNATNLLLGNTTITFPGNSWAIGNYMINYSVYGSSTTVASVTLTATSNCVLLKILDADTASGVDNTAAVAVSLYTFIYYFSITGPGAVLTLSNGTLPGTPTGMDLIISQINYDLLT